MTERSKPETRPQTPIETIGDHELDQVIGGGNGTSLFRISHPAGSPQAYTRSGD